MTFDPVLLNREENQFIIDHAGEAPVVAARAVAYPVNSAAVMPIIQEVYNLMELEKHEGMPWCGVDAVKQAAKTYIEVDTKWESDAKRRKAPRFPSMFAFDARGKGHRYGVGSDSGRPRTYFDAKGERKPFALELVAPDEDGVWQGPTSAAPVEQVAKGLKVDAENRRIECELCGHTEKFNPDSRGSYNSARARISKHLRNSKIDPDSHRELHTVEFA